MQTPQEKKVILDVWLSKRKPADLLDTEHNGVTLYNYFEQRGLVWSLDNLDAAVKVLGDIATGGKLQFAQKTIVKTVYVEKPRTAKEIEQERIKEAQSHGFQGVRNITTEFDRYEKEHAQPNETQQAAIALKNLHERGLVEETEQIIRGHRGHTHGQTSRQQEALCAERDRLVRTKASPEKVLESVKAMRDSFSDTSISSHVHGVPR